VFEIALNKITNKFHKTYFETEEFPVVVS